MKKTIKRAISIIAAAAVVCSCMSAFAAAQGASITADEVKEMIYSTGLSAYPDLWDLKITDTYAEEDVLNPETRTVKDVMNTAESYRQFYYETVSDIAENKTNPYMCFRGYNKDGEPSSIAIYLDDASDDTAKYSHYEGERSAFAEEYDTIAEILNTNGITSPEAIRSFYSGEEMGEPGIYVEDSTGKYVISAVSYKDDIHASYLGREVLSIKRGDFMTLEKWIETINTFTKNYNDDTRTFSQIMGGGNYEQIDGDEIRETDTRAAYVGTESKFADVSGDLVSYVNELADMGVINGYNDGTFRPSDTVTRAEAAAMLVRMLKYSGTYGGEFTDVSSGDWYADDVSALVGAGIISGYEDGTFKPASEIKYREIFKMLLYALGYSDFYDGDYPTLTNKSAMQIGLTEGLQSFDTASAVTRGDLAVILSNALDTPLRTWLTFNDGKTGGGVSQNDITLADYLSGKKLNGELKTGVSGT